MLIAIAVLAALAGGIFYSSLFEWTLHKFVMHRPILGFRYPFRAHALTHHKIFSWDATYLLQRDEDLSNVTFAWWNFPALLGMNALVVGGVALAIAGGWNAYFWVIGAVALGVLATYYFTYEYLHFCMHVRTGRWFEKTSWFRFIDDHHRMHHRNPGRNLNVVLPLADFLLRTKSPGLAPVYRMAAEARRAAVAAGR
jgi:hypothetical protein